MERVFVEMNQVLFKIRVKYIVKRQYIENLFIMEKLEGIKKRKRVYGEENSERMDQGKKEQGCVGLILRRRWVELEDLIQEESVLVFQEMDISGIV